ncbi:MAG: flagellar hook-associated protein FlgK [Gammaproteobacteria bacterium]|nr:flagellar hook-associated protein FlgK [Sideroxydans sp.]MBU3904335.1 flagellar hook-associated protein FlgK [Gammaproteobacteria bacterium]MBU4046134.1 flagellar hook-associated protein FlgK [Gammaproteobacteria bacterium]MBU4150892.1 flagellar hook-associated protein FlgK [Gammaproteobacteria bacterium]
MSGIYGIGVSALRAAQAGMASTSHNIANANTPGYSRQEITQAAGQAQNTGSGYFGQGVDVTSVVRRYDQFLSQQVLEAQTSSSSLNTQYGLSQQLTNLFGDSTGGLTPTLQDFFGAVNDVATAPESIAARQTMMGSAQSLVNRLNTLDQRANEIRDGLNGQISNSVNSINSYAKQIAVLNEQIVQLQARTPGQPPNDLLDQRDQVINQLSQEIRVTAVTQYDGSMDVFIGSGQSLVVGNSLSSLRVVTSQTDPSSLEVAYSNNGNVSRMQQSALQGGNLGGYLDFRQNVLDPAVNALGRIAIGVADTFNQQHQQGMDLKGAMGGEFFTMAAPRVTPSGANTGTAALVSTFDSSAALTGEDYNVRFDGTNYNVTNASTNATLASFTVAQLATAQVVPGTGITLQLSGGAAVAGDTFGLRPTVDGARGIALNVTDPTKIAAAVPVRSNTPLTNLGTGAIANTTVVPPLDANLQQPITITFDTPPTTYTVSGTGAPAGPQAYTDGGTITINGWTTKITGTPLAGDEFTVGPNNNASTDGGNMLKLASLQTAYTMVNSTTSFQGAYGQLISQVGTQTRELQVTSTAQNSMLSQVTKAQQSVSGVNLDEEAANLMRYQQAYQAAAKAMSIAGNMFDTLLSLGN